VGALASGAGQAATPVGSAIPRRFTLVYMDFASRSVANSHAPAVSPAVSGTLTGEDSEGKQRLGPRMPVLRRRPSGWGQLVCASAALTEVAEELAPLL
jgi:hypothetical protein